jgi:hypothetical protein
LKWVEIARKVNSSPHCPSTDIISQYWSNDLIFVLGTNKLEIVKSFGNSFVRILKSWES